jgi:hypothetical protein
MPPVSTLPVVHPRTNNLACAMSSPADPIDLLELVISRLYPKGLSGCQNVGLAQTLQSAS